MKFNAIMAYVNATEINLPERCSRCAAARAALAQAFANALDVPVEWIVSIEARSMYFLHEFPRPETRQAPRVLARAQGARAPPAFQAAQAGRRPGLAGRGR